ncbi:MAG: hypothetical protein ACYC5O_00690 [Anaerolineae bacterium]
MKDELRDVLRKLRDWSSSRRVALKDGDLVDAGVMAKATWSLQQDARRLGATQAQLDRAMGKRQRVAA